MKRLRLGQGHHHCRSCLGFAGGWLLQITDDGLAMELTVKGSKYYRDDKLNQGFDEFGILSKPGAGAGDGRSPGEVSKP